MNCIVPALCEVFTSRFPGASAWKANGRTAEECLQDRKSDVHKTLKKIWVSQNCLDDIESLDALMELFDDYADNYVEFINRFHVIWETYVKSNKKVYLERMYYVPLEKCHDKYWNEEKAETLERDEKETKREKPEKNNNGEV